MTFPPKYAFTKETVNTIPETPGIYMFWSNSRKPIYIGKSKNLRSRIRSYTAINLLDKTRAMVDEATQISYIEVISELEALLLEAKLIRKFEPIYNVELKDDKHPLYIKISKDKFPRVITARKDEGNDSALFIGPFPSSTSVREVLKLLRRIFPYADHLPQNRQCFYSHIGLCNPCPSYIVTLAENEQKQLEAEYRKNIAMIKGVLSGRITIIKRELERKMETYSNMQMYENAKTVRDQLQQLDYITHPSNPIDSYIENPNFISDIRDQEVEELKKFLNSKGLEIDKIKRIECFDVAHLSGNFPTASMVTFINGESEKRFYRHFRIRQTKSQSDYHSMVEVIERRKKHFSDWGEPDLIIVDGGKAQVSAFIKELRGEIKIIGLAKRLETIVIPKNDNSYGEYVIPRGPAKNLIQRLRDEAHRFARRYHHKLVKNDLIEASRSN